MIGDSMRVGICGHFGGNEDFFDGQTVKTKNVYEALCNVLGDRNVSIVDTYSIKSRAFDVFFGTVRLFFTCDCIMMLPAHNGLKIFSPLFYILKKLFKKKIFYSVIGGWLPKMVVDKPELKKYLKCFDGIFVETNAMKNSLVSFGFDNIVVIPNFKQLSVISDDQLQTEPVYPLRLCTFSRVMKEKGIEDAIKAVETANRLLGHTVFALDIYGQVDKTQVEWFENLKNTFPEYVSYCGCVPFDKSVDVLKEYFALLFPTLFYTEGIPGTIIDAYAAGIPVISSKWESFDDIIDDAKSGFGYEFGNTQALIEVLQHISKYPDIILNMKEYCVHKAHDFLPQNAISHMISFMEG